VIKSSEVFEVFFSYTLLEMGWFLLNSNKHCESKMRRADHQPVARVRRSIKIEI
jgi:hypothetical protein